MSPPRPTSQGPLAPRLSLQEGDLIAGRYRIESLVHTRTVGIHFAATDLTRGARVSVHVLVAPGDLGPRDEDDPPRVSFLAGARRAKALEGPHVARVLDAGVTEEGHPFIVREHLGSESLGAHLREHGALGTSEAVDVALAVCDAIAEAHAHGLVHGSLGPHAVHVAWSLSGLTDIKVTGIGTAAAECALALGGAYEVEAILRAPEQLRHGSMVDGRADVWAIGVLLHTMLAGASPFAADTPSGASLSVILDEPPSLAGVPDDLAELVERALAKDPEQRPRTVLDLAEAIAIFATHSDIARDRVAARRPPLMLVVPTESDPTLVVDKHEYDALVRERSAAPIPPTDSTLEIPVDIAPSVRELLPAAPARPLLQTLARRRQRDVPTRITRKPALETPRRRALKFLGLMSAAASVALVVLISTEGARLSRHARPVATAAAAPVAPPAAPELPPPVIALPAVALPDAPSAPRPSASPAKRAARPPPSTSSAAEPSSPSPSGSTDDLRRFLDDRR